MASPPMQSAECTVNIEKEHHTCALCENKPTSTDFTQLDTALPLVSLSLPQEIALIFVICSAQFLALAGLAQSIAPLHVIGQSFGTSETGELSWFPAAYSLTMGCFILPAGRWGDIFGHKRLLIVGYAWFALWSLVAGFSIWSHSQIFFDICRALQGIGPAILLPNGIAILARTYPPGPRKEMVLSIFGAAAPTGFVMAGVFAGIFTEFAWWPWSYWVHGIMLAVLAVLSIGIVPADELLTTKWGTTELDLAGTIVGISGLVLFNFAWNEGPVSGWQEAYVPVLLVVGILLLGVFVYLEFKVVKYPLLPLTAFTLDTSLVFGCISAGWASFGIWVFYFWQFLEVIRGDSILQAAAEMCPAAISGAIAAVVTGLLISRVSSGSIMTAAMVAFCVGITLVATNPANRTYWAQLFLSPIITSWGMDMSFPAGVIVLSNHMPRHQQGLAASLVNTVVNYSISIGIGMAGTAERYVKQEGTDTLGGYRAALYVGIGLDVLGFCLALGLAFLQRRATKAKSAAAAKEHGQA